MGSPTRCARMRRGEREQQAGPTMEPERTGERCRRFSGAKEQAPLEDVTRGGKCVVRGYSRVGPHDPTSEGKKAKQGVESCRFAMVIAHDNDTPDTLYIPLLHCSSLCSLPSTGP